MKNLTLLFITHETSRTGAPLMLLYFMEWIRAQYPTTHMTTLSLKKGSLTESFEQVSDVFCELESLQPLKEPRGLPARIVSKMTKPDSQNRLFKFLTAHGVKDVACIYSNTVVTLPLASRLKEYFGNTNWVAHIHELQAIMQQIRPDFRDYISQIDHCIAASELVKKNLIQQWNVPQDLVTRIYECSKVNAIPIDKMAKEKFIVGGSGTAHWRKGSDLFIQVAMLVKRIFPNKKIEFVWVGGISKNERIILEEDIRKCGLQDTVRFVGETAHPESYFKEFDIFLMTSREDPFPLVCIEVGMLGKPIVTFENAVGTSEIIKDKGGMIVPYLDINAMTKAVTQYIEDPLLKKEHGAFNKKAFAQFTPEIICPEIYTIIKNMAVK